MTDEEKKTEAPAVPETKPEAAAAGPKKAPVKFRCLLGEKKGMTQVYDNEGQLRAVTVIEAGPCPVIRVKTDASDHYKAVQLAFGKRKERSAAKPYLGQFKASGAAVSRYLREFRLQDTAGFEVGQVVDLEGRFKSGDYVDVHGVCKGKGFAGVMKRHNFRGMPGSHGASDKERSPGSLAARRSLGRVLPGQRMAGHLGDIGSTTQKIEVVQVDPAKNLIYVNGSVPGARGTLVTIAETVKNKKVRIVRKVSTVLRDKMGNIIVGKGAKARALAEAKAKAEKK